MDKINSSSVFDNVDYLNDFSITERQTRPVSNIQSSKTALNQQEQKIDQKPSLKKPKKNLSCHIVNGQK